MGLQHLDMLRHILVLREAVIQLLDIVRIVVFSVCSFLMILDDMCDLVDEGAYGLSPGSIEA